MAKRKDKTADRVRNLFETAEAGYRQQWEFINQKGFDFANDNQITAEEKSELEAYGMPTFTINRITPVVEMLNFYATSNTPRWQAVGAEGSDVDVAAVFSDIADYIWYQSDGGSLFSNAINDAITKSTGYFMISVDPDMDRGLGDVIIEQPDPFDVYVDPKSRDLLFRDASYIIVKKVLPRGHLKQKFPDHSRKIHNAAAQNEYEHNYSEKAYDETQHDFTYKDIIGGNTGGTSGPSFSGADASDAAVIHTAGTSMRNSIQANEHDETLLEYIECYEKIKLPYVNVFYRVPPDEEQLKQVQQQIQMEMQEKQAEMMLELKEQDIKMREALEAGDMLPERYEFEIKKAQELMQQQLESLRQQRTSQVQAEVSKIENKILGEKEFKIFMENETFAKMLVDAIQFYDSRVKLSIVIGDKTIADSFLPDKVREYPIIPFHYKWTGTPYPMSAVSPLIGKQQEMNKAHQLMIHNASLGSSLRFQYEEGSIDPDYWEKYSSAPGALLPVRPGATPPTAMQPMPLSNGFFNIVQHSEREVEYLAGIYSSMQGNTGQQHDTYRGMLAMDEYGTRRVKQWLSNSIEPALRQIGRVIMQFSQAVYTSQRVFRVVQPNNQMKEVEVNTPMYNDLGESVGKFMDYEVAKFDVRVVSGSTLPVNRWAYLEEMKDMMQMGIVDDVAVLAEADVRNKDKIMRRKNIVSQLQGKLQGMEQQLSDKEGAIETLERQLIQAGIKSKVLQGAMEVNKKVHDTKTKLDKDRLASEAQHKNYRNKEKLEAEQALKEIREQTNMYTNNKGS